MHAQETDFISFLEGSKQFQIPIYQRKYSWAPEHCEKLFDDILKAGKDDEIPSHFFGSIVYVLEGVYSATGVKRLLVIDGQQRLTSLMLLLFSLSKAIENKNNETKITKNKIYNNYLFNSEEQDQDDRRKVVLTEPDKETLNSILESNPQPVIHSKKILDNLKFFDDSINQPNIDLDTLYKGICKLKIVDISLSRPEDNPQLIFESLNSTGLELSAADLIRNFLLMGLENDEQEHLYKKFWYPMEQSVTSDKTDDFDRFMKDFLTVKQTDIPIEKEVYQKYKEYFFEEEKTNSVYVEELHYYSKFFVWLLEKTDDMEIKDAISNINILRVKPAYPFLLQVFSDYEKKIISKDNVLEIINLIQSYVFRRQIVGGTGTSGHNRTFALLYSYVDKENSQTYVESIKAALIRKQDYERFPKDDEFSTELRQAENVYGMKSCIYMLLRLENFERTKEKINSENVTIEHIMPQDIQHSQSWQDELGVDWRNIHPKIVNTLGNLTITELNSEMSNNSFKEKKEIAFDATFYHLSAGLRDLEHWNKDEIEKRSKKLADLALRIWEYPSLSEEILSKYPDPYDVVEEEDEDGIAANGWNDLRKEASPSVVQTQDKLIKKMEEKFNCFAKPRRYWLYFYTTKWEHSGSGIKNCFAVLNCGKTVFNLFFRVDPQTFEDDNPKIRQLPSKKGWFFKHGKNTERRMRVYDEDIPLVLEKLEHAYKVTKEQVNYKGKL